MAHIPRSSKALEVAINSLYEYFDTVQIFVSKHDDSLEGSTRGTAVGKGNVFARLEQVRLWVEQQEGDMLMGGNEDAPPSPPDA